MGRKVPIDRFSEEIERILREYGIQTQAAIDEATKVLSKKGAQAVRAQAKSTFGGSGDYAKGWTSRWEGGRVSAQGVIYNHDIPGLPHLLENGHANRGGGRTPGRMHIKNVEEKIVKEFEQKVKNAI